LRISSRKRWASFSGAHGDRKERFERELASERVKDKVAASRKKGKWTGGSVPLGYDAKDKKLVVNTAEAETVRTIFRRYLELKSFSRLVADLDKHGIVTQATEHESRKIPGRHSLHLRSPRLFPQEPYLPGRNAPRRQVVQRRIIFMNLIKRAGAWCNGEVAYLAWDVEKQIKGCVGFMVTRVHETGKDKGKRRILPTWIAFTDQNNPQCHFHAVFSEDRERTLHPASA
jgi:hypothetical protein